jgi:hypothetical protein
MMWQERNLYLGAILSVRLWWDPVSGEICGTSLDATIWEDQ